MRDFLRDHPLVPVVVCIIIFFIGAVMLVVSAAEEMQKVDDSRCVKKFGSISEEAPYYEKHVGCMLKLNGKWVPESIVKLVYKVTA